MASTSNAAVADDAFALIKELRNNPDIIPPYNETLLKKCAQTITELYNANLKLTDLVTNSLINDENLPESSKENSVANEKSLVLFKARQMAIDKIKQCCCAYINERMQRLKRIRWKSGGFLTNSVKANLSKEELVWWKNYNKLIFDFQNSIGENGVNLFNFFRPPKTLFVNVRAVKDYGEFETSDGITVIFTKDSVHFLPLQDCENLIRRGILEYAN